MKYTPELKKEILEYSSRYTPKKASVKYNVNLNSIYAWKSLSNPRKKPFFKLLRFFRMFKIL